MKDMSLYDEYVHQVGDVWIVAHWNDLHSQYQSSNTRHKPWLGYCYTYSCSLAGLASGGIRTYETRRQALRAARRVYGDSVAAQQAAREPLPEWWDEALGY